MTITWTTPVANGPIGPGVLVNLSSDFIGPIPAGSGWIVELLAPDNETFLAGDPFITSQSTSLQKTFGVEGLTDWRWNPGTSLLKHGASGILKARLVDDLGDTIDSGSQNVTIDLVSGLAYIQTALLSTSLRNIATQGTDIDAIAVDVADIKTASFADFGSGLQVPLSQLITAPPLGAMKRLQIVPDLTGEGSFDAPSFPSLSAAFGVAWEFISVPDGYGNEEGVPDRILAKAVEFNLIHTLQDGSLENTASVEFPYGDALWIFQPALPSTLRYWISPGIVLRLFWLVPFFF